MAPSICTSSESGSSSVFTYREGMLFSIFIGKTHFVSAGLGYSRYGYRQYIDFPDKPGVKVVTCYRYVQLPLLYSFKNNWKKVSLSVSSGLLLDFLDRKRIGYNGYLSAKKINNEDLGEDYRQCLINLYLNPGVSVRVTSKTFLLAGPDVICPFISYKKDEKKYFLSLGFQIRLVYTLV